MKLGSTRTCKPRASLRLQSDSHQRIVSRRRSSRLQSSQLSKLPHILGSYYESQNLFEQLQTGSKTSHPVGDVSHTYLPRSAPVKVSALVSSGTQFQEYSYPRQTLTHHTRKRRPDTPVDTSAERPPKRARLTEKNLKAFEKMGARKNSTRKKSTKQLSSTTTTTDKDFGPQLQRNNVVFNNTDVRAPDDEDDIRELLNRSRESEPPNRLDYNEYLVATQGYKNKATIQHSAYPLLSKRTSREARILGYGQSANYAWSVVDNHLTTGLSDAEPDIFESYRKTDYPPDVVDILSSALAPTSYDIAMPAFTIEVKGYDGSMQVAQLQCAYDGALMTEGARAVHSHLGESDDDFYGKTQALTAAYNGEILKFYGHHATQIPLSSQSASGRVDYHQYLLSGDCPRDSFESFQTAYKHTRNAQDIGYKWATERKDALWAYTNRGNTSPYVPTDSLVPASSDPPGGHNCDANDDEVDPIAPTDNAYASLDAQTYNPITPPQSSKDVPAPLEPQQLSVPTVTEPREDVDFCARGHKKTRARIGHAVVVEELRDVVDNSKSPKTRKREY